MGEWRGGHSPRMTPTMCGQHFQNWNWKIEKRVSIDSRKCRFHGKRRFIWSYRQWRKLFHIPNLHSSHHRSCGREQRCYSFPPCYGQLTFFGRLRHFDPAGLIQVRQYWWKFSSAIFTNKRSSLSAEKCFQFFMKSAERARLYTAYSVVILDPLTSRSPSSSMLNLT